jgi:hypothetical protein
MACLFATGGTGTAPAGRVREEPALEVVPGVGEAGAPEDGEAAELDVGGAPWAAASDGGTEEAPGSAGAEAVAVEPQAGPRRV